MRRRSRSVALAAIALASALSLLREQVAWADEPKELKVFVKLGFHDYEWQIGPISFDRSDQQLVIRSAEELAASTRKAKDAKDTAVQKDAAFQKQVQAELAKLLKVESIDWDKQMIVAISGGRFRFKKEVEFLTFAVRDNTLTVKWELKHLGEPGLVTTPKGIALVERFAGKVQFDPDELK